LIHFEERKKWIKVLELGKQSMLRIEVLKALTGCLSRGGGQNRYTGAPASLLVGVWLS
jgi:hypothetical protein